jgi:hypothetical protein
MEALTDTGFFHKAEVLFHNGNLSLVNAVTTHLLTEGGSMQP